MSSIRCSRFVRRSAVAPSLCRTPFRPASKLHQTFSAQRRLYYCGGMDGELGVRASSPADFERLLRANAHSMLRFADFVLHDRSAAEDAVQEAFMIAFQRRETLRDEAAFTAWLRTIVLRECLRWRRL